MKTQKQKKLRDYSQEELNNMGIMYSPEPYTTLDIVFIVLILVNFAGIILTAVELINHFTS